VCDSGGAVSSWYLLIRRHQRARCQAEIPLIILSKFPEPALIASVNVMALIAQIALGVVIGGLTLALLVIGFFVWNSR
jgi:hypothetical protein